jgi:4-hydroxybenzoate polyprenyltransferase
MPDGLAARLWEPILAADRFVRLHYLSFSVLWPLLGATTVRPRLGMREIVALVGVACCFHAFAMILNDVIDLPIDRTQPKRQRDPLVRGVISPGHALSLALLQPFLTVPLTIWLGGTFRAFLVLGAGFTMMALYDLLGKRCPFPPLTDVLQGLAWGTLAWYGALIVGGEPNAMTWATMGYVILYILLVNGVHGSLRDLENDFKSGATTTAIFLGARPVPGRDPIVPPAMARFAASVLAGLIALLAFLVIRNDYNYELVTWIATAIAVGVMCIWLVALQPKVVHPRQGEWETAFRLDVFLLTMSLPVAFAAYASAGALIVLLLLNVLALALFPSTPAVARWAWGTLFEAVRSIHGKTLAAGTPRTD